MRSFLPICQLRKLRLNRWCSRPCCQCRGAWANTVPSAASSRITTPTSTNTIEPLSQAKFRAQYSTWRYSLFSFLIEVELTCSIVLVSSIQHGNYKIMGTIPCVIQYILVADLSYVRWFLSINPTSLICSFLLPFGNHKFVLYIC